MGKLADEQVIFRERVLPGAISFLPLLIIYPTFWLTLAPFNPLLGSIAGGIVTFLCLVLMVVNSPIVSISNRWVRVGKAAIDPSYIGHARVITPQNRRSETGISLDARAFIRLQPSVKGLIRLEIEDPKDPVPYWLFSSSQANQFVECLNSIREHKP